jgi:hypothetical protein
VRLEGLGQFDDPMTSCEFEPATFYSPPFDAKGRDILEKGRSKAGRNELEPSSVKALNWFGLQARLNE